MTMTYSADQEATFGWDLEDYSEPVCPACGDYIDYCQGHGRISDPLGYHIVSDHHDFDKHDRCHSASDCREDN